MANPPDLLCLQSSPTGYGWVGAKECDRELSVGDKVVSDNIEDDEDKDVETKQKYELAAPLFTRRFTRLSSCDFISCAASAGAAEGSIYITVNRYWSKYKSRTTL
jgi:hypothetical protein